MDKDKRQKRIQQKDRNFNKWLDREETQANRDSRWMSVPPTKQEINKRARTKSNHGKLCSCVMCGNPRKHNKEQTIQEQRMNGVEYEKE